MDQNDLFIYTACYDSKDVATEDLEAFQDIAATGVVGKYDSAIVTKDEKGKVHVDKHGTPAASGGWKGAVAGGVIGLLFPPSILAGAFTGTIAGVVAGKLWGGMSRSDLRDLGEVLDHGESGLVIVGESTLDEYIDKALKRATKKARKEAKAELKELEKELD